MLERSANVQQLLLLLLNYYPKKLKRKIKPVKFSSEAEIDVNLY